MLNNTSEIILAILTLLSYFASLLKSDFNPVLWIRYGIIQSDPETMAADEFHYQLQYCIPVFHFLFDWWYFGVLWGDWKSTWILWLIEQLFWGGTTMGNKQYKISDIESKMVLSQKKFKDHIPLLPFYVALISCILNYNNLLVDCKSSLSIKSLAAGNWLSFRSIHFRALNCSALHICHFATSNSGLS